VLTSFAFSFANFFQPGVFWPELADYKPMQVIAVLALLASLKGAASYDRMDALRHPAIKWMLLFLFAQVISVHATGVSGMVAEFGVCSTSAVHGLRWTIRTRRSLSRFSTRQRGRLLP